MKITNLTLVTLLVFSFCTGCSIEPMPSSPPITTYVSGTIYKDFTTEELYQELSRLKRDLKYAKMAKEQKRKRIRDKWISAIIFPVESYRLLEKEPDVDSLISQIRGHIDAVRAEIQNKQRRRKITDEKETMLKK